MAAQVWRRLLLRTYFRGLVVDLHLFRVVARKSVIEISSIYPKGLLVDDPPHF